LCSQPGSQFVRDAVVKGRCGNMTRNIRAKDIRRPAIRRYLPLVLVSAALVAIGVFIRNDLQRANQKTNQMYAGLVRGLDLISELQYQTQEARRTMLYSLTTNDSNLQVEYADQSRKADARAHEIIVEHLKLAETPEGVEADKQFERDWNTYLSTRDEVIGLILEGSINEATQLDLRQGVVGFDRVREDLQQIKRLYEAQADKDRDDIAGSFDRSVVKLAAILCLALLLVLLTAKAIQKGRVLEVKRSSEVRLNEVINAINEGMFVINKDWRVTVWNRASERTSGRRRRGVVGRHLLEALPELKNTRVPQAMEEAMRTGDATTVTDLSLSGDPRERVFEGRIYPFADGLTIFFEDVTERKLSEAALRKTEEQLRRSQKMESIGTLAGGIAHDFNNILTAILGYTELAESDLPADASSQAYLSEVMAASNRARDLVKQILTFSRQNEKEYRPMQLQPIIKEALKLLRASLPASIEIRQRLASKVPSIVADATEIHQIIMNLGTNSMHSMREHGGVLSIELAEFYVEPEFATTQDGLHAGPYVRLTLSDTGHGMDRTTVDRVFDPFFTTKAPGEGTGLGLSVVHGIVKSCGGAISLYSEAGTGTTFNLYFPAYEGEASEAVAELRPVPRGDGERILLVDDEEPLVNLNRDILERLGYEVTTCRNGVEALERVRAGDDRFDLIVTDFGMPRMNGADLAKASLEARPDLPVIMATGYAATMNAEIAASIGIRELIMKPTTTRSLGEAVSRVLGKTREVYND
jgi:PAS domain S-box-containing protein